MMLEPLISQTGTLYIDDVSSINNSRFAEFLPLIYPPELEIKETTDTASSASFLDLYLEFDDSGQFTTLHYTTLHYNTIPIQLLLKFQSQVSE